MHKDGPDESGSDVAAGLTGDGIIICTTVDTLGAKHIEGCPSLHPPFDMPHEGNDLSTEGSDNRCKVCCVTSCLLTSCTGHGGHSLSVVKPLKPADMAIYTVNEPCDTYDCIGGAVVEGESNAVTSNLRGKTCLRTVPIAVYVSFNK